MNPSFYPAGPSRAPVRFTVPSVELDDPRPPEYFVGVGTSLKNFADHTLINTASRVMVYLEAISYFIKCAHAHERRQDLHNANLRYELTLVDVELILTWLRTVPPLSPKETALYEILLVLSMRCNSILLLKVSFLQRRMEPKNQLHNYHRTVPRQFRLENRHERWHDTSSDSESSGYLSDYSPLPDNMHVSVSHPIYAAMRRETEQLEYAMKGEELWDEADIIKRIHSIFFVDLPLQINSPMPHVIKFINIALKRLNYKTPLGVLIV